MSESSNQVLRLLEMLHSVSPYEGFPLTDFAKDVSGWHSSAQIFKLLIYELKPSLVVEIGTWLGASALEMAGHLKELSLDGQILCVDTWLGGMEFWLEKSDDRYKGLRLKYGYPQVYYQFLANVLLSGAEDVIAPFPQTSLNAASWLRKNRIQADLVYVDASHEEQDVYEDVKAYWPLIRPGGVLFGDDYDEYWPGVVLAVNRFAEENRLKVDEREGFWIIRKSESAPSADYSGGFVHGEATALRSENVVYRARLLSLELENAKLIAEKAKLNAEAANSEIRAGFFHSQLEKIRTEAEQRAGYFYAELERVKAEMQRWKAEGSSCETASKDCTKIDVPPED